MRRAPLLILLALTASPSTAAQAAPATCPGDAIATTRAVTGEFDATQQGAYVLIPFDVPRARPPSA